eukprot:TRINITY_DN884_c0_g2_i5.p1 TRINITY_DN884_c0_g2~~TRINITY_DN884_c0_g2_i5.p1  ORF type:complete len:333 (-),score=78.57 TRINITY_DN884_c0_g2_i5:1042-1971(-)
MEKCRYPYNQALRPKKSSLPPEPSQSHYAVPLGNTAAFYSTSTDFASQRQSTRGDHKFYTKADFYKAESVRGKGGECRTERISVNSEELVKYENEIKNNIDKMLEINGYPKLELKKQENGRYTVSLEDLTFILATMISDIVRKNKEITQLEIRAKTAKKTEQEGQYKEQLRDLQARHEQALREIKQLEHHSVKPSRDVYVSKSSVLEEVQRLLKVKDVKHVVQSVRQMIQLCRAIPQMELFIREVSNVVQSGSPSSKGLENVIPTLRQWASERGGLRKRQQFKQKVCEILYGEGTVVPDYELVQLSSNQ